MLSSIVMMYGQRHLTEDEWDELEITKPVILEFYANWCAPCKQQGPIISRLAQEFPGIDFYKVNIDREKDWFSYETEDGAIPMIQFFSITDDRNYDVYKSTISGFMSYTELRDSCQQILRRFNEMKSRSHTPLKVSTAVSDTIVNIKGEEYHLALSGAVDLGLRVRWAAYNVGATRPEQDGDYYAWGETETKSQFSIETYKHARHNSYTGATTYLKYSPENYLHLLQASDDVATQKWGGEWSMPTQKEFRDLIQGLEWVSFNLRGVFGLLGYSTKTKNAIFFPASGCMVEEGLAEKDWMCDYWSLEIYAPNQPEVAIAFCWDSDTGRIYLDQWRRSIGCSVRAVYIDK